MKATQLIDSIVSRSTPLETYENGVLKHRETSGWMTAKQAAFLISLMENEGNIPLQGFGFEFSIGNVFISKPTRSGARSFRKIDRF